MKTCGRCGVEKPLEDFHVYRDRRHTWCKECCCMRARQSYYDNRERRRLGVKVRMKKISDYIDAQKNAPCVDCGRSFPSICMDFDHLDGKLWGISQMRNKGMSLAAIDAEIAKCELVCANCHRIRTQTKALLRRVV